MTIYDLKYIYSPCHYTCTVTSLDGTNIELTDLRFKGPVTGPTDELRIDHEQIPAFMRVLRNLEGLCVVVFDVQCAHESRTNCIRTALIALKTR